MRKSLVCILFCFMVLPVWARDLPEEVLIPAGTLHMGIQEAELAELAEMGKDVPHMSMTHARWWFGDEMPMHEVEMDGFFMDTCEVTNREYARFVKETGYRSKGDWERYAGAGREDHPVMNVTWADAKAYAEWAGKRLPTEAEWEYAARGGTDYRWFPWGNQPDPERANYRAQGESFIDGIWRMLGLRKLNTRPVGSYPANGFGLYDMVGNVAEWTADTHRPYPGATVTEDPYRRYGPWSDKPVAYTKKVVRGGGWETPNAVFLRITGRSGIPEGNASWDRGFRCARDTEPEHSDR